MERIRSRTHKTSFGSLVGVTVEKPEEYTLKGQFTIGLVFGVLIVCIVFNFINYVSMIKEHIETLEDEQSLLALKKGINQ